MHLGEIHRQPPLPHKLLLMDCWLIKTAVNDQSRRALQLVIKNTQNIVGICPRNISDIRKTELSPKDSKNNIFLCLVKQRTSEQFLLKGDKIPECIIPEEHKGTT